MMAFFHGGDVPEIMCMYALIALGLFILFICVLAHISRRLMERANRKISEGSPDE